MTAAKPARMDVLGRYWSKLGPLLKRAFQCVIKALRVGAVSLGVLVFILVVFGDYDRALSISGRTEVVAVRSDGTEFAIWLLPDASFAADADAVGIVGPLDLQLRRGAEARFVRTGRGPLSVTFTWPGEAATAQTQGCPTGAMVVGVVQPRGRPEQPLCDSAVVTVPSAVTDPPLVVSLRGSVTIGEEVRAGAGQQPMILDATALLYARHSGPVFDWLCRFAAIGSVCDRFIANTVPLSAGDALHFRAGHDHDTDAIGFFRLDPAHYESGVSFDVGAPQASLEIRRLKGKAYEIAESLFERITRSPLIQALNSMIVAFGVISVFLRLPETVRGTHGGSGGHGHAACAIIGVMLMASGANAQQSLVRAGTDGQAMLRSRADRCYAIAPQHVLGGETSANLVAIGRRLGDADLLRRVPAAPEDIALMIVRAIPEALCPAFEGVQSLDGLLHQRGGASLRMVQADGTQQRYGLTIQAVDVETFEVRLLDGGTLAQGMSGGTVLVGDQPAGLLVDVADGGQVGRVARLDRIFERLSPYLSLDLPRSTSAATGGRSLAYLQLELVRWGVEPVGLANRADNLLEATGTPWRVAGGGPAEIVLRLEPGRVFDGIELDAGGLEDAPRAVEVLVGRSERGPWQSVGVFALETRDHVRLRATAPSRSSYAMVRATGTQPGETTMALTSVRFKALERSPRSP